MAVVTHFRVIKRFSPKYGERREFLDVTVVRDGHTVVGKAMMFPSTWQPSNIG